MDQLTKKPIRNRRLSKSNTELYFTLIQIQELNLNFTDSSIKQYLDLLKYLSTQINLEKEIQCSFILTTTSMFIGSYLSPSPKEVSDKIKEIQELSKNLMQCLMNYFAKPAKNKIPQNLLTESSNLLTKIREIFIDNPEISSNRIKVLSKILSMVPSTPFELLLVSLNNLHSNLLGSNIFPCFTYNFTPYLPEYPRKEYTLVLDLDETLVHMKQDKIHIRPGARDFINTANSHFELVLFTAATTEYADYIMQFIDPNHFMKLRLYRQHTTRDLAISIKDLKKLGRDLSKVIIVDNLKESFQLQQNNGICIKTWTGESQDSELKKLMEFLITVPYKNLAHVSEGIFSFFE